MRPYPAVGVRKRFEGMPRLAALAVVNGLPPDQTAELGRYQAIETQLVKQLNGGTLPTSSTSSTTLQTLSAEYAKAQCLAAKSLAIRVNPQFGALNYRQISIVPEANTLSAPEGPPSPSPTGTAAPQLSPPC